MRECNICTRKGCSTVENYRRGKSKFTPAEMGLHCPTVQMPKPFKVKLLYHAILNSPQATMEILARVKIEVREIDRYPGFRLIINEGGRE